jgi:hypothetical protein
MAQRQRANPAAFLAARSLGDQLADLARSNGAGQELVDAPHGVGQVDGPNAVMKELKGDLGGSA